MKKLSTNLHLRFEQKLYMSPYLHQMMEVLQLQVLDLEQRINEELQTNPLLDLDEVDKNEQEKEIEIDDSKLEDLIKIFEDSSDMGSYNSVSRSNDDSKLDIIEGVLTRPESLQEHLLWQLRLNVFNETDYQIGERIISNIEDKGYLKSKIDEIASGMNLPVKEVEKILFIIHTFEPYGVGANDLQECLLLQLKHIPEKDRWVEKIISNYFMLLYKHKKKEIAHKLGIDISTVQRSIEFIQKLDPSPGLMYNNKITEYVIPDAIIECVNDEFVIIINDDWIPRLRIHKRYRKLIKNSKVDKKVKQYLKDKVKNALLFIKSIEQRKTTLYRIVKSILKFQKKFFYNGPEKIAPLTLKVIAEDVDVHESTVSRVTSNKYMQTPFGIYEMKYFFSKKIHTENEGDISSKSVMELMKDMIEKEIIPLSDDEIMKNLRSKGIKIARRTISKYRQQLKILPSYLRKK